MDEFSRRTHPGFLGRETAPLEKERGALEVVDLFDLRYSMSCWVRVPSDEMKELSGSHVGSL